MASADQQVYVSRRTYMLVELFDLLLGARVALQHDGAGVTRLLQLTSHQLNRHVLSDKVKRYM